jgi:hypothetical protein
VIPAFRAPNRPGHFTTLFPDLCAAKFDESDLRRLADVMSPRREHKPADGPGPDPEEDWDITAAYTYLGQFVDHDLSYDPTSSLHEFLDREQIGKLADFRTPRFDLDNLYGRGPDDQPYMYAPDGIRMQLGKPLSGNPDDPYAADVPRAPNGRALTGDPRDDENRIVSQLHTIFLRFHNQVADKLGKGASFPEVREQVRWHYQMMLVTDFLPTVIDSETYGRVFGDPYNPVPGLWDLRDGLRSMPVEFSVAAYRFGHSMIRAEYRLNADIVKPIFSVNSDATANLGGFRPIPDGWAIDWNYFIGLTDPPVRRPQHAFKIGTSLASPLRRLPDLVAPQPPPMLALRDLERGNVFGLPSGQDVARTLGLDPIPDDELIIRKAATGVRRRTLVDIAPSFAGKAPLWTYILSEAQVMSWEKARPGIPRDEISVKLGPVGSRIVADVFAALLIGDRTSYLHADRPFRPIPEFSRDGSFGLAELINAALRPPA